MEEAVSNGAYKVAGLLGLGSVAAFAAQRGSRNAKTDPDHSRKQSSVTFIRDPDGRYLFLRRSSTDPWKPGWWDVPGGGIDPGESPIAAAMREAKEESGIHLRSVQSLGRQVHQGYTRFIYWAELALRPRVSFPDGEHDSHRWLYPHEAHRLKLIPGLSKVLDRLPQGGASQPAWRRFR